MEASATTTQSGRIVLRKVGSHLSLARFPLSGPVKTRGLTGVTLGSGIIVSMEDLKDNEMQRQTKQGWCVSVTTDTFSALISTGGGESKGEV